MSIVNNFRLYTSIVIEFVFHHRFSAILVTKILPNLIDDQRLLTGLQNQHTSYCHNLVGDAATIVCHPLSHYHSLCESITHLAGHW